MKDDLKDFYKGGPREVSGPPALWTFAFFTFVMMNLFIFMGFDILLPTLSIYLEGHGRNEAEIGQIFATFTISAVLMRMLAGRLANRVGAMTLVRLGLFSCMLAGGGYYWAHSTGAAMLGRFVHGAGFGLASTLITALASQIIPPTRMGEGMGYLGLGTTLALALGPFFGIWLMNEYGFFVMFMVVAACYVLSIAAVSSLPKIKLASARPGAPKPALVLISLRVWPPSFLMFLVGLALSTTMIFLALYCKEIDLPYAGHFFVLSTAGIFFSRITTGRIHDRIGHKYVLIPASLLLLLTMILLAAADSKAIIFTASIFYGLSTGAIFPSVQALAMSSVPIEGRTEATASFFNAFDIGVGLGSLILGMVAGKAGSYGAVYVAGAWISGLFLVFYIAYYLVFKSKKTGKNPTK